jgi:hypothetical protein
MGGGIEAIYDDMNPIGMSRFARIRPITCHVMASAIAMCPS